jgi:hypothetical protein
MEHMEDVLRARVHRALDERQGEARTLTGITIESGLPRFEPRLCAEFSDGFRTSQSMRPSACFAFCERHAVWDVEALRALLLRESRRIYAQMLRERRTRCEGGEQRPWIAALMRRFGTPLSRRRRRALRLPVMAPPPLGQRLQDGGEAWERGLQLLEEQLSPEQRRQYDKSGYFDVTGGTSGKRYRIRQGSSMNIELLDKRGRRVCTLCFMPKGNLVTGDVMLAQKVALEVFEREALKIANKFY